MADMEADTDTLLVMLESIVGSHYNHSELLDALLDAEGSVDIAAQNLRGEGASVPKRQSRKRKISDLDQWLVPPPHKGSRKGSEISKRSSADLEVIEESGGESESEHATPSSAKSPGRQARERSKAPSSKGKARSVTGVSAFDVLRPPPPAVLVAPRLAPMTLGTPALIAQHTSTTIHPGVLPQELACRLFYVLLDESEKSWRRSKWYIADKLVESPHLTSFYVREGRQVGSPQWNEAAQYWYNGQPTPPPARFPSELEEACQYVERVVNDELKKRERFPLEWLGEGGWKANVAATNRYKGAKEGVGFHSDQMTYLGPCPTIASLSLGTSRTFRLRETIPKAERSNRAAQTFNISLSHNSLLIMHPPCQEHFKHTIPILNTGTDLFKPSFPRRPDEPIEGYNERINITFRFYRPDFAPHTIPRCKCNVPTVLRANQKGSKDSNLSRGDTGMRYFWMCYAGAQHEGKSCGFLKVLDMAAEGRGSDLADPELNHEA